MSPWGTAIQRHEVKFCGHVINGKIIHQVSDLQKHDGLSINTQALERRSEQRTFKIVHVFVKNSHQVEQLGEKGKKFLFLRFLFYKSTFSNCVNQH